jgi:putative FmdB family regulatory protein
MPLYEYECESCSSRFERIQKFTDPPPEACPKCGGPVRKLLSSPAIQFKGSGFYITDYGRKGEAEATAKRAADKKSSESGTKDAGKTDAPAKDASPSKDSGGSSDTTSSKDTGASKESNAPKETSAPPAPATPAKT